MALVINNRVRETTSTEGTGAVTLGGAVGGFQTFAAGIGNSNTTYYAISINTENEWEVGLGTLSSDSSTLARTNPPLESSNGDALVDFSAGSKEVFCTLPSEKAVYLDASGAAVGAIANVVQDTSPTLGGDLDVGAYDITSASDADVDINPNGTGDVVLKTDLVSIGGGSEVGHISSNSTQNLKLSTYSGTNSGTITIIDGVNEDIELAPNGTGTTVLKGNTNPGTIKFNCESNTHAVTLKGPVHSAAANYTLTLPTTDGAADEFLQTDGDGVLTWAAAAEVNPAITSFTPTAVAGTVNTTVTITGTDFVSIPKIEFQTAAGVVSYAPTVSFTSATTIAFTTGTSTLTNGTNVYLIVTNPDGEAVRSSTLLAVSASPTWDTTTLANTGSGLSVSYNLDTTADSAATIQTSVVSGALPSGVTIGSTTNPSGTTWRAVLSGTMPVVSVETAYSFTLRVTDDESQTADQAFTLTSTVDVTGGGQFN
jgi:hypothetical protein